MAIISISRAYCSNGKLIAEKVAERLGYECISSEIILEASDILNVTDVKLAKAIHDGPSFLERITHGKEKYVAYVRAALLDHIKRDNVVYHGLAGHFFLQDISHAVKIRIVTDFDSRISEQMARENIAEAQARKRLHNDDAERRKWSRYIYGIDTSEPELYDFVLNLNQMSVDDCINMICHSSSFSSFEKTPESEKKLNDMAMAATAEAMLIDKYYDASVIADDGHLNVVFSKRVSNKNMVVADIERLLSTMKGVENINVIVEEEVTSSSLMYMANR